MKKLLLPILLLFVCFSCQYNTNPVVEIVTDLGKIEVEIYEDKAPVTAKNFLKNVKGKAYENSIFYRVVRMDNQPVNPVKIEVIQGGLLKDSLIEKYEPIVHESTEMTGIKHLNGVISMARMGPGTASTEIFICVGDQPELDFAGKRNPDGQGFSAFGKVIKGMDVVKKIHIREDEGQMLKEPVKILEVRLQ